MTHKEVFVLKLLLQETFLILILPLVWLVLAGMATKDSEKDKGKKNEEVKGCMVAVFVLLSVIFLLIGILAYGDGVYDYIMYLTRGDSYVVRAECQIVATYESRYSIGQNLYCSDGTSYQSKIAEYRPLLWRWAKEKKHVVISYLPRSRTVLGIYVKE